MVEPRRAAVQPRVFRPGGTYALPLAEEIRALLDAGARGATFHMGTTHRRLR